MVYSLVDSVNGFFSIDPVSGMVTLEKPLDRESRDSYRVRVQAADQAGQQGALSSQVGREACDPSDPDSSSSCVFCCAVLYLTLSEGRFCDTEAR